MSLDFLAGCVGGCAGVLVGHPLDTVKVHLQTQDPRNPRYRGILHCMKTIVAQQKVFGLYKGISSPLAGVGFINAIVFGIYGNVQRHSEDPGSLQSHLLAGSVAGLLQSFVCAPMELAKTRIQLQLNEASGVKFKGPYDCIKHVISTSGIRGAFKGLGITILRDVPGFASYFVSYEYMMRQISTPNPLFALFAGGMAGIFSWLACYPMDVLKTCIQVDGMSGAPKYKGIADCVRKKYAEDGYRFFVRGLMSTLVRAFPMNAACFSVVTLIMELNKSTNIDVVLESNVPLALELDSMPNLCESQNDLVLKEIEPKHLLHIRNFQFKELPKEMHPAEINHHVFDDIFSTN